MSSLPTEAGHLLACTSTASVVRPASLALLLLFDTLPQMKAAFLSVVFAFLLFCSVNSSLAKIYFKETFDEGWRDRWVESDWKTDSSRGKFGWSAGKYYNDPEEDKGLQTTEDYRYYTISAKIPEPFSNRNKTLILQYSVKHEQKIDCGGAYLKLLPEDTNQKELNSETKYNIMFGPDICGSTTRKVHFILSRNGKNHLLKKDVPCETDEWTHLYTMILRPNNTYQIKIDGVEKAKGSLEEDWDLLPPKEIPDPNAKKPADWVDEKEIDDPNDKKPEGWDDIPPEIKDPNAKKPEDWDDELDGEWEPPMIPNPDYKGPWKPRRIPNPAYKGEWVHPKIPNPDYKPDPELYAYDSFGVVAFEVWQVKSGTIIDNIVITDSEEEAEEWAKKTLEHTKKGEKAMKEEEDKKKKEEEERKKKEEEEKKKKEEEEKKEKEGEEKEEEKEEKKEEEKKEGEKEETEESKEKETGEVKEEKHTEHEEHEEHGHDKEEL
jgi:calreticulin